MNLRAERITADFSDKAAVEALAFEAFPPEEYLAPDKLIEMSREDGFDFWALYDGALFVGFMAVKCFGAMAYLFFLAIEKPLRAQGYGGRALETMKELYPDAQRVVDFEMPDSAAPNARQRESRRHFYLKNGYRPTGRFLSYLGVDYEIFCADESFDFTRFQALMSTLKIDGFHPCYFAKTCFTASEQV